MGILNDISKKAQEYAGIAVDKSKSKRFQRSF